MRKRIISRITALALCCLLVLPYVASQSESAVSNSLFSEEYSIQTLSTDPPPKHDAD